MLRDNARNNCTDAGFSLLTPVVSHKEEPRGHPAGGGLPLKPAWGPAGVREGREGKKLRDLKRRMEEAFGEYCMFQGQDSSLKRAYLRVCNNLQEEITGADEAAFPDDQACSRKFMVLTMRPSTISNMREGMIGSDNAAFLEFSNHILETNTRADEWRFQNIQEHVGRWNHVICVSPDDGIHQAWGEG